MSVEWCHEVLKQFYVDGELQPASEEGLDRFEKIEGRRLPESYREYASVFGPGRLNAVIAVRIAAPGSTDWNWNVKLHNLNTELRALDDVEDVHSVDVELWKHALFFGTDHGDRYLWDTREITVEEEGEMAVWVILRNRRSYRLCDTFESFIRDVCMNAGVPENGQLDAPFEFWAYPD